MPTIQRLPADILAEFFVAWLHAELNDDSGWETVLPFHAARVCGSWREAALAKHELWTYTRFSCREMISNQAWLQYHACFVQRSGVLGFHIRLTSNVAEIPRSGNPVWTQFCDSILVKARVIDLDVRTQTADASIIAGLTFPRLHTLRIRFTGFSYGGDYPAITLPVLAPVVRHIELYRLNAETEDLNSLDINRRLCSVDCLRNISTTFSAATEFSLTTESLYHSPCEWFVWASLRVLRVIVDYVQGGDLIPFCVQLPNLETLEVKDNRLHWSFWRHFIEASCPALAHLCVVRNHMDFSGELVDGLSGLSQLRTLTFRDGSLNEELVGRLILPKPPMQMPFPGLRAVHFEDTVPLDGFRYRLVQIFLQKRYLYLQKNGIASRFDFTCRSKRRPNDPEENDVREQGEKDVRRYNEDAWRRFQTHV
ncbi:hypothetical protein AURDEDRAFT_123865 [Auricularia subglabra TFB-10046 SS5]|nr:hypothetical protein AURDEDRAFT_123865 [Auricularia subglabra TFB-10046 SS5]